ncbi:MAG: 4,5-DOPA dioxygenase extradiol [Pseudomonadota bacterium]|nr:4,5-DOPA dioxygenase extradiol [Pseudomonadota bacterium]
MTRMPALFIGHGSPMNTLELNDFTDLWQTLGEELPRPKALLVVSAHWFIGATAVTAMPRPRTIHDFYGFPQELFEYQYPAPGSPELAAEVAEAVKPVWVGLDHDQWGLDHGTWSVLGHFYPQADIPVVQLSINALKPLDYHVELGARLTPLRDQGVMIVASGNVVHNLGNIQWKQPGAAFDWARRFDDAVIAQLSDSPADVLRLTEHPDFAMAVPTPDHFIPLLYVAGLAREADQAQPLVQGFSFGSISMTCYGVGVDEAACQQGEGAAPLAEGVPADQTNM